MAHLGPGLFRLSEGRTDAQTSHSTPRVGLAIPEERLARLSISGRMHFRGFEFRGAQTFTLRICRRGFPHSRRRAGDYILGMDFDLHIRNKCMISARLGAIFPILAITILRIMI